MEDFDSSPFVRSSFDDDDAWKSLVGAASAVSSEGFQALLRVIDDRSFDGLEPQQLASADWQNAAVLFVVDAEAQSNPQQPILCVDLLHEPGRSFRCIPSELWGVENNLRLANMDFADFAESAGSDGVFRGF